MTARYLVGDVFDRLAELETGSVDLVITSPPFLALRSYLPADHPDKGKEMGSEATPAEFLDVQLRVMAELRRVTAGHGSVCVELGDTYAGGGESGWHRPPASGWHWNESEEKKQRGSGGGSLTTARDVSAGWPLAKSRALIPELFRIALAYGINPLTGQESPAGKWLVRNVVTWCRPNPPVGALGDKWRPATSDVVVACTSAKRYWDDLATRKMEPVASPRHYYGSAEKGPGNQSKSTQNGEHRMIEGNPSGAPLLDYWEIPLLEGEEPKRYGPALPKPRTHMGGKQIGRTYPKGNDDDPGYRPNYEDRPLNPSGSPLLDYWVIPPGGYPGAHYAVFPPELVVPLVRAMCPEKVCRTCGEPSRRIVETEQYYLHTGQPTEGKRAFTTGASIHAGLQEEQAGAATPLGFRNSVERRVTNEYWSDCGHDNWRPGVVLDPFAGSGTTLLVATGHGHDAIGIDLDERNAAQALERVGPFLLEVV